MPLTTYEEYHRVGETTKEGDWSLFRSFPTIGLQDIIIYISLIKAPYDTEKKYIKSNANKFVK